LNRNVIVAIVAFAFVLFASYRIISESTPNLPLFSIEQQNSGDAPVGFITDQTIIEQTIITEEVTLNSFGLLFATWARMNECEVYVELINGLEEIIQKWTINGSDILDNQYIDFTVDPPTRGDNWIIKITSNATTEENAITLWQNTNDEFSNGSLYINGVKTQGDLIFRTRGYLDISFSGFPALEIIICIGILTILITVAIYIIHIKKYQTIIKFLRLDKIKANLNLRTIVLVMFAILFLISLIFFVCSLRFGRYFPGSYRLLVAALSFLAMGVIWFLLFVINNSNCHRG
jgi:hypothetical protein